MVQWLRIRLPMQGTSVWPPVQEDSISVQYSSVAQSCLTLYDPMNRSTPGLPVYHRLPEITQTHVHWVSDAKRSLVFPILFFTSISSHWSLKKALLSLPAIIWNCIQMGIFFLFSFAFRFLFFSQLFVKPPQTAILLFCISFSWGWSWFLSPVQYHKSPSVVHQALYQI